MPTRPDPLAILARVRRIETDAARRLLAERLGRAAVAAAREAAAHAALEAEAAEAARDDASAGGMPGSFGTWIVRGLAERERAALGRRLAEETVAEGRAGVGAARAAERAVERLRAERVAAAAREAARKAARVLDDVAAARR